MAWNHVATSAVLNMHRDAFGKLNRRIRPLVGTKGAVHTFDRASQTDYLYWYRSIDVSKALDMGIFEVISTRPVALFARK